MTGSIWLDPSNIEAVNRLLQQIELPRGVIPFCGAGLSAFLFPTWRVFLQGQARRAKVLSSVNQDINDSRFEEAASRIASAMGQRHFDRVVQRTFSREKSSGAQFAHQAVAILPSLAAGPVITTNFDHVLEQVFREAGHPFDLDLWGARTRMASETLADDYRILLKLHGDADDPEDRVLTQDEYVRHYGGLTPEDIDISRPLPSLLIRLFTSRSVLFLGCSLEEDRYLKILATLSDTPEHFALVETPDPSLGQADRERYLRAHRITPIWYPIGHYELLPPFLNYLVKSAKLPKTSTFRLPVSMSPAKRSGKAEHKSQIRNRARQQKIRIKWESFTDRQKLRFLESNGRFLYDSGFSHDYARYAIEAIGAAQRLRQPLAEAELLNNLHLAYKRMGRTKAARSALKRSQKILDFLQAGELHVVVMHNRALMEHDAGRFAEAASLYRKSLSLARKLGDDRLEPIWRELGRNLAFSGNRATGLRFIRRALARSKEKNDHEGQARALIARADIYDRVDDSRRMADALRQALPLTRDVQARAQILDDLGVALYHLGNFREALLCYLDAAAYERASDDLSALVSTLKNIAWLHFDAVEAVIGSVEEDNRAEIKEAALHRSCDYYEQALAYARALGDPVMQAKVLTQKALVSSELGDVEQSLDESTTALRLLRRARRPSDFALVLNNHARILDEKGDSRIALRFYRNALVQTRKGKDPGLEQPILYNMALTLRDMGRFQEALSIVQDLIGLETGKQDRYSAKYKKLLKQLENRRAAPTRP